VWPGQLRQRAVRGGAFLFASRLAIQAISWAVTLAVARLLRPSDYGLVTTATVFVGLADLLAEAGIGRAVVRKKDLHADDLAEAFTLNLVFSCGLYALLFATAGPIAGFLKMPEFIHCLRVLAVTVLLVPFRAVPLAILDRKLRLGRQSAIQVLSGVVQSGLVLVLATTGWGFWALVAGILAARVVETVALAWFARWRPQLIWPGRKSQDLLRFGIQVSGASLLWFFYSNSDYAILGKLVGPEALGAYALAFQLISLPVQKLTAITNQAVYPVFCRLQDDPAKMRDWYLRLTAVLGLIGIPALAGLALVADDAIPVVLGSRWVPAVLPLRLLSVVGMVMVVSASLPPLFNALGRPDINVRYALACTLLLPPGFAVLGSWLGVVGVCLVWLVGYPLLVGALVFATRGLTGFRSWDLLRGLGPTAGIVVSMVAAVGVARWLLADPGGVRRLVLEIAAGGAASLVCLVALGRSAVVGDVKRLLRDLRHKDGTPRACAGAAGDEGY
jgi:O-antigen/teichoic acid export membrane protein